MDPQVLPLESDSTGQPTSALEVVLNVSPPRRLPVLTLAQVRAHRAWGALSACLPNLPEPPPPVSAGRRLKTWFHLIFSSVS